MQNHLRAGLVGLIFALLLVSTSAAPILQTQTPSTSSISQRTHHLSLVQQQQSPFAIAHESSYSITPSAVASADGVAARDIVILYRRKSIFTRIKDGFKKLGRGIKHVAEKIGHGIKTAAQKVGHFIKTTGAKIAKVGLKIWSTATKAISKVAQFIPVIGKPLSKAMDGAATVENKVSDSIHVKLGKKLDKAMHRMDKGQKVMGYIPRELGETLEERGLEELDERELYEVNTLLDARGTDELRRRDWDDLYVY